MNQFKKAKQLRIESGQSSENITDIKTAGITQKENDEETISTSASSIDENLNHETQLDKTIILSENEKNSKIEFTAENTLTEVEVKPPISASDINTNLLYQESTVSITDNLKNISSEYTESNTLQLPNMPTAEPVNNIQQIYEQQSSMENNLQPIKTNATKITNAASFVNPSSNLVTPNVNFPTNDIPIPTEHRFYNNIPNTPMEIQGATESQNKVPKKTAPNIFAPKSEAKSMRKSLVLKPTSVRIAENYCINNGGSFNELIQTLLEIGRAHV